jgi:hypothetical protein
VATAEESAHAYALTWFTLHSNQRMQLVNFWLVSVAFLVSGFVQAEVNHLKVVAFGIAVLGALASTAFCLLDIRTRKLIQVAEDALRVTEMAWTLAGIDSSAQLSLRAHEGRASRLDSYRVVIEGLQALVGSMFAMAALYSLLS